MLQHVLAVAKLYTGGGVAVTQQQCKQVIFIAGTVNSLLVNTSFRLCEDGRYSPSLDDQRQIRGVSTVVDSACLLLVRIGGGEVIGQFSRTLEHLAGVIGAISDFNLSSQVFGFLLTEANIDQVAVGNTVQAVARSADFLVHLIPTANTATTKKRANELSRAKKIVFSKIALPGSIKSGEGTFVRPSIVRGINVVFTSMGHRVGHSHSAGNASANRSVLGELYGKKSGGK